MQIRYGVPGEGRKGFSLIEVALVVGIAGLLALLVMVNYHSYYLRQTTLTTAKKIRSDLDFSVQHALARGTANRIRYNSRADKFQVADPSGIVKSTEIPANVQVAVSGFQSGNPASGATADIVPAGYWIGFLPRGATVTGQPALIVVASSATWYVISVSGMTGKVAGPTRSREQIPLTDNELSALLGGSQHGGALNAQTGQSASGAANISSTLSSQIKNEWKIP